jgi:hypothetical protein
VCWDWTLFLLLARHAAQPAGAVESAGDCRRSITTVFTTQPTTVTGIRQKNSEKNLFFAADFFSVVHTTAAMPTRAATAAAAAANMRTTRSRKAPTQPTGKENSATTPISSSTKGKEKAASKKPARSVKAKKVEEVFCSCRGVDDGTPMVQCGTCDEWSVPLSYSLFLSSSVLERHW